MSLSLVVGLGNPGRDYERSRHNLGFMVVDALAARLGLAWSHEPRFEADVTRWSRPEGVCWLVKPLTFMNESGRSAQAMCRFHKLAPARTVAVYDDLTLEVGRLKISVGGSAGGHNGVASLLQHLGPDFARLRFGIGPKMPREMDLKDYVLGPFSSVQLPIILNQLPAYADALTALIELGPAAAMNLLNRKTRHEPNQA